EDFVDHDGIGLPQRFDREIVLPYIEQFIVPIALIGRGDALDPRIGAFREQVEQQEGTQRVSGTHFLGPRVRAEPRELGEAIGFDKDIQEVYHAIALADEVFDPAQTLGFRLRRQAVESKQPTILVGRWGRQVDKRVTGELAVKLGEGLRELLPQGSNEGSDLYRLRERLIIGGPLSL